MAPQALPKVIPTEAIIATTKTLLNQRETVRDQVANTVIPETACFANVLQPLIDIENETQSGLEFIGMLRFASPDKAAREASEEAVKLWGSSTANLVARKDIYLLVKAVAVKAERLDSEAAKYLERTLQDFTRCGHGRLDEDQVRVYLDGRNRIDDLRRAYNKNIRDENGGLWFSEDELVGVPEQELSRFTKGEDPDHIGMRLVHFNRAELQSVLKYAANPATRKEMYQANSRKLPNNLELFKEVLIRRNEQAHLLGYVNHATFRLERRVAKTFEWVYELLDSLEDALISQAKKEKQSLLQRKKKYLVENPKYSDEYDEVITPWDEAFYVRLSQSDMNIQHKKIAEYFPLQHTLTAMLDIFASFLQLRFELIAPEVAIEAKWHEDVEIWSVWDMREASRGEFVGYLYADVLWRPNKYPGSQNVNIQCGYLKPDGSRVYPATILMCGFPRPTATSCALLEHHNVVSLFHELGHGIHDLVSRTSYIAFHGPRSPPDFAEAPSVMLEKWCWMIDELVQMSCHYTSLDSKYLEQWQAEHPNESLPPKKIPVAMLDGLAKSRNVNRAMSMLHQVAISRFDMAVHDVQNYEDCVNLNLTELWNTCLAKLDPPSILEPEVRGHGFANFSHLLAGYDAGYYSYLSAQVFAADIFQETFIDDPRNQTAWERYRRGILEYGGSRDELKMLEKYLGRSPSVTALLSELKSAGQNATYVNI